MKILFYDVTSPFIYDSKTLETKAIGGTEATVIRVAEALSNYHDVVVAQKYRTERIKTTKVEYVPIDYYLYEQNIDVLICVRSIDHDGYRYFNSVSKKSKIKTFVLCQNFDEDIRYVGGFLEETNGTLISVSNHLMEINKKIVPDIKHACIYNPIDDDLFEDETPRDRNKLVFFSSPHKGLFDTFYAFKLMKTILPELELYYSNPGYILWPHPVPENAVNLGSLPYNQIIKHVREAFCVFYINKVFPETFGLVYAEANAVGTPVLAHDFGAASEILHPNNPVIDCDHLPNVRDTFLLWYFNNPPKVGGVEKFRISNVVKEWNKFLTE